MAFLLVNESGYCPLISGISVVSHPSLETHSHCSPRRVAVSETLEPLHLTSFSRYNAQPHNNGASWPFLCSYDWLFWGSRLYLINLPSSCALKKINFGTVLNNTTCSRQVPMKVYSHSRGNSHPEILGTFGGDCNKPQDPSFGCPSSVVQPALFTAGIDSRLLDYLCLHMCTCPCGILFPPWQWVNHF